MDMMKNLNAAIDYVEKNLCSELNIDEAARIACVTTDSFMRFFSYITDMTLKEYVRRRRLTLAAEDLKNRNNRIIDVAVKYGYDSADAFSRAFAKQHGITPNFYRKNGGTLTIYPPASFHIVIKGARKMKFKIIKTDAFKVFGVSKEFDRQMYKNREELREFMWTGRFDDVPGKLCEGQWNQKENVSYNGKWYGIWKNGRYMIAREEKAVKSTDFESFVIPADTYVVFETERGGYAGAELPRLFELIFDSWLPTSKYKLKSDLIIEVYHLWTNREERKKKRYYEVWLPVEYK